MKRIAVILALLVVLAPAAPVLAAANLVGHWEGTYIHYDAFGSESTNTVTMDIYEQTPSGQFRGILSMPSETTYYRVAGRIVSNSEVIIGLVRILPDYYTCYVKGKMLFNPLRFKGTGIFTLPGVSWAASQVFSLQRTSTTPAAAPPEALEGPEMPGRVMTSPDQ